jgi:hypothetical protein
MKKLAFISNFIYVITVIIISFVGCNKEKLIDIAPANEASISVYNNENLQDNVSIANYSSTPIPGQYIVAFNVKYRGTSIISKNLGYNQKLKMLKNEIPANFKNTGIVQANIKRTYASSIKGFSAQITNKQVYILLNDERVESVEQDYAIVLSPINEFKGKPPGKGNGSGDETLDSQEYPWGIYRVGGGVNYTGSASAWIIDTGIDMDHPDLNVDQSMSKSFLTGPGSNRNPDDQNGHGTHVAGTVAAINNTIGVVGVAAGANVIAVRVLDKRGRGTYSGVIAGVDYVAANASYGDVANMSLGGGASTALDNAVIAAANNGIKFALAAGNSANDADNYSPSRANHSNIYTISAMNANDDWAYFSNFGNPPIEFCAPGVAVKSSWKGGGYNSISGTSMAAPHVCGLLLLGTIKTDGRVNGDPDGYADWIAHY